MPLRPLILVCVLAGPAAAEDKLPPYPDRGIALGIGAHAGLLDGIEEHGWGPNLELALGDHRVQYFVEGGIAFSDLGRGDAEIEGRAVRGGAGIRWLARSFELGRHGAIDMHLEGFGGVSRTRFDGMAPIVRPDLGVGVGYQVRGYWNQRKTHVATAVCRGTCTMSSGHDNSGLMAVFGVEL